MKVIRGELLVTRSIYLALNVEHTTDFFLDQVSDLAPTTTHFFEESSVVKTTSRRYVKMHHSENQGMEFRDTHQMLILLGNFWYFGKLVAEVRRSQPEVGLYQKTTKQTLPTSDT